MFPFACHDDFLPADLLQSLGQKMSGPLEESTHPSGYKFAAIQDERILRFLYRFINGPVARRFNRRYTFSPIYKLPQLYRSPSSWQGLPAHTDNQPGRDLAMIIYLSKNWRPECGGELELLSPVDHSAFQVIEPFYNRAVFFPLGPDSWHRVRPVRGGWLRSTLIQDWALV